MSDQEDIVNEAGAAGVDEAGEEKVAVNPMALDELLPDVGESSGAPSVDPQSKLGLIMDVEVPVMVAVGRVKKTIQEVLSLGEGHVIDLGRTAGEPVDLLVNGKLIARGEVVVVDEHYGLRISEIVSPNERLGEMG